MADPKKNPTRKPPITPTVEDVDVPIFGGKSDTQGESRKGSENSAQSAQSAQSEKSGGASPEKSDPSQSVSESFEPIRRKRPASDTEKGEKPDQPAPVGVTDASGVTGESGAAAPTGSDAPTGSGRAGNPAITESGMIRKDDEIDRTLFGQADKVAPDAVGFSPDTDVAPFMLVGQQSDPLSFGDLNETPPESEPEVVYRRKVRKKADRGASLRTLAFGIAYLVAVILCGVLFGVKIVGIGNDIFAFTFETDSNGDPVNYTVVITDEGMSPSEVGKVLEDAGVIKYDWVFKLYAQLKKKDNFSVKAGSYTVSAAANYDAIMSLLNPVPPRQEISITFTEGMNTDEIINLFLKNGIGTREGFEQAINYYPYNYWFMDYLKSDLPQGRFYRLDGYLYPDTYRFFSDSSEVAVIDKLLDNFNRKFGEEYKPACDDLGLTPDEVVRIASMIEAEVKHAADFIPVASVFHNRMKSSAFDGLLQSDASVQYYFYHTEGSRHEEITPEDLLTDTPYNTYLYKGLPPGAICSPTLTALRAALYPDSSCPYYYFVSRPNGFMYYATTLAEHNRNIEKVREESESLGVGEHE